MSLFRNNRPVASREASVSGGGIANSARLRARARRARAFFLFAQGLHLCVAYLALGPTDPTALFYSGLVSVALYGLLAYSEFATHPFAVSPFLLYVGAGLLRVGLIPMYLCYIINGGHEAAVLLAPQRSAEYFFYGHFIMLVGDWFFVAGYAFHGGFPRQMRVLSLKRSPQTGKRLLWASFIFYFVFCFLREFGGRYGVLAALGQPVGFIESNGGPAFFFMLLFAIKLSPWRSRLLWIVVFAAIFLVEMKMAIVSTRKQKALMLFLAVFVFVAIHLRARSSRGGFRLRLGWVAISTVCFFVIVSFVFSLFQALRTGEFAARRHETGMSTEALYARIFYEANAPWTDEFQQTHRLPESGIWHLFQRATIHNAAAWAYHYVEDNGTAKGRSFATVPVTLIPRFIWPDKPLIVPAREFTVLLGLAESAKEARTATAMGMAGSLYWNGGFFLVIVAMFLNGVVLAFTWRLFARDFVVNPIATTVCFSLFTESLRWFESVYDANIIRYLVIYIFFLPLNQLLGQAMGELRARPFLPRPIRVAAARQAPVSGRERQSEA